MSPKPFFIEEGSNIYVVISGKPKSLVGGQNFVGNSRYVGVLGKRCVVQNWSTTNETWSINALHWCWKVLLK